MVGFFFFGVRVFVVVVSIFVLFFFSLPPFPFHLSRNEDIECVINVVSCIAEKSHPTKYKCKLTKNVRRPFALFSASTLFWCVYERTKWIFEGIPHPVSTCSFTPINNWFFWKANSWIFRVLKCTNIYDLSYKKKENRKKNVELHFSWRIIFIIDLAINWIFMLFFYCMQ